MSAQNHVWISDLLLLLASLALSWPTHLFRFWWNIWLQIILNHISVSVTAGSIRRWNFYHKHFSLQSKMVCCLHSAKPYAAASQVEGYLEKRGGGNNYPCCPISQSRLWINPRVGWIAQVPLCQAHINVLSDLAPFPLLLVGNIFLYFYFDYAESRIFKYLFGCVATVTFTFWVAFVALRKKKHTFINEQSGRVGTKMMCARHQSAYDYGCNFQYIFKCYFSVQPMETIVKKRFVQFF